jgi:hypothetical protein
MNWYRAKGIFSTPSCADMSVASVHQRVLVPVVKLGFRTRRDTHIESCSMSSTPGIDFARCERAVSTRPIATTASDKRVD